MMKLTITTGTEKDFFEQGKEVVRKLDRGERVEPECVISFEEPQELLGAGIKRESSKKDEHDG